MFSVTTEYKRAMNGSKSMASECERSKGIAGGKQGPANPQEYNGDGSQNCAAEDAKGKGKWWHYGFNFLKPSEPSDVLNDGIEIDSSGMTKQQTKKATEITFGASGPAGNTSERFSVLANGGEAKGKEKASEKGTSILKPKFNFQANLPLVPPPSDPNSQPSYFYFTSQAPNGQDPAPSSKSSFSFQSPSSISVPKPSYQFQATTPQASPSYSFLSSEGPKFPEAFPKQFPSAIPTTAPKAPLEFSDAVLARLEEELLKMLAKLYSDALVKANLGGRNPQESWEALIKQGLPLGRSDPLSNLLHSAFDRKAVPLGLAPGSSMQEAQLTALWKMVDHVRTYNGRQDSRGLAMWRLHKFNLDANRACLEALPEGEDPVAEAAKLFAPSAGLAATSAAASTGPQWHPTEEHIFGTEASSAATSASGHSRPQPHLANPSKSRLRHAPPSFSAARSSATLAPSAGTTAAGSLNAPMQGLSLQDNEQRQKMRTGGMDLFLTPLSDSNTAPSAQKPANAKRAAAPDIAFGSVQARVPGPASPSPQMPPPGSSAREASAASLQAGLEGFLGSSFASLVPSVGPSLRKLAVNFEQLHGTHRQLMQRCAMLESMLQDTRRYAEAKGLAAQQSGWASAGGEELRAKVRELEKEQVDLLKKIKDKENEVQENKDWAGQTVAQVTEKLSGLKSKEDESTKEQIQVLEAALAEEKQKVLESEGEVKKAREELDRAKQQVKKLQDRNKENGDKVKELQSKLDEIEKKKSTEKKRADTLEKHKNKLQDEIAEEKKKVEAANEQAAQAKSKERQADQRYRSEQKAKEEAEKKAEEEKRAREQAEASWKKKEENLKRKAEAESRKNKEKIQALEREVAQLSLETQTSVLGAPPTKAVESAGNFLAEINQTPLAEKAQVTAGLIPGKSSPDPEPFEGTKRCIACLNDAVEIIFLPCAHRLVCHVCSKKQEEKGMNICLSCKRQIDVRVWFDGRD